MASFISETFLSLEKSEIDSEEKILVSLLNVADAPVFTDFYKEKNICKSFGCTVEAQLVK